MRPSFCQCDRLPTERGKNGTSRRSTMFSFRRPTDAALQAFRAAQGQQSLTYSEVGATRGDPPAGWHVTRHRGPLGDGPAAFTAACAAVRTWRMFDLGWIYADAPGPPEPGVVVAVVGRVWPL